MIEEEDIVARLRDEPEDERAWAAFHTFYRRLIVGVLFFRSVSKAVDQDDFTAEVFFRFLVGSPWHEDWTTLPSAPEVRKYLLGRASSIASHARERTQRHAKIEAELSAVEADVPDDAPFINFEYVVDHLSIDDRDLAILYYERGISLAKLAEHYQTTYEAAGVRLHRLRRKMMAIIREKPFPKR
jgi:DNA-directed RNA polymerase specialized sigma24 family protein